MKKTFLNILILVLAFALNLLAQEAAIVRNFASVEIDSIQRYLDQMEINNRVYDQGNYTSDSLAGFDIIIWDDLSYASGGITDTDVFIFDELRQQGKKLYFIGDDLTFAIVTNLSPEADTVWTNLLHMTADDNFSNATSIVVSDSSHFIINGPFGIVESFNAYIDPDPATATDDGARVVMKSNNGFDVVVIFEDSTGFRSVTQNALAFQPGDPGQINRKILFKNTIAWLIAEPTNIAKKYSSPADFKLYQNFPNPFNPTTTINYLLNEQSVVELKIFDVLGREVKTLVSRNQNAGRYSIQFNASSLPSGIYFYTLIVNSAFSQTRKMILIK